MVKGLSSRNQYAEYFEKEGVVHINKVLLDYARCTAGARKVLMKICLGLAAETLACREIGTHFNLFLLIGSDGRELGQSLC